MRKYGLLIGTAVLLTAGTVTAAEDYTCATPPTCAELGYTNSASECNGKGMLYCPFDKAKVFCREIINCDELGYTDKAADCDGTGMLKCPSDSTKVKCDKRKFKQYDYYYSDGTWSTDLISGKTVIGIKHNWTSSKPHIILSITEKSFSSQSAALSYCNSFSTPGRGAGSWNLYVTTLAGYSKDEINNRLKKVSGVALYYSPDTKKYWSRSGSSCQYNNSSGLGSTSSCSGAYARCTFEIN